MVAGGANSNEFKVFEKVAKTESEFEVGWSVSGLKRGVFCSHISNDCSMVAFGGSDKKVYILNSRRLT